MSRRFRFDEPPAPYQQPAPGERARQIDHPVQRPEPVPEDLRAERKSGGDCDWRRTLGLGDPAAVPDEDRVKWTRWPP
jgi:hypothetical protein